MAPVNPSSVLVVDVGSARTKITAASMSTDGNLTLTSGSVHVSLFDRPVSEAPQAFEHIRQQALAAAQEKGMAKIIYLGAEAFRLGERSLELQASAKKAFASFSVLTPSAEASLFYRSVLLEEQVTNFVGLDVGGGSVQLVWGKKLGQSHSAAVGTFALEKRHQTDLLTGVSVDSRAWIDMTKDVEIAFGATVDNIRQSEGRSGHLVVGSNVMKSFFRSMNLVNGGDIPNAEEISTETMLAILQRIAGKPYPLSYDMFHENHHFMHGADKLFAVVMSVIKMLGLQKALGTNASVSKGLCRLAIENPVELSSMGIAPGSA